MDGIDERDMNGVSPPPLQLQPEVIIDTEDDKFDTSGFAGICISGKNTTNLILLLAHFLKKGSPI